MTQINIFLHCVIPEQMLLKNYIYFTYASKPNYDFKFMKTFKNLYNLAGQKPKCFIMLAGPNIYILIYLANYFILNFEQIPAHTLVKSDVDICPFQL
jgi:hypothetical protein